MLTEVPFLSLGGTIWTSACNRQKALLTAHKVKKEVDIQVGKSSEETCPGHGHPLCKVGEVTWTVTQDCVGVGTWVEKVLQSLAGWKLWWLSLNCEGPQESISQSYCEERLNLGLQNKIFEGGNQTYITNFLGILSVFCCLLPWHLDTFSFSFRNRVWDFLYCWESILWSLTLMHSVNFAVGSPTTSSSLIKRSCLLWHLSKMLEYVKDWIFHVTSRCLEILQIVWDVFRSSNMPDTNTMLQQANSHTYWQ